MKVSLRQRFSLRGIINVPAALLAALVILMANDGECAGIRTDRQARARSHPPAAEAGGTRSAAAGMPTESSGNPIARTRDGRYSCLPPADECRGDSPVVTCAELTAAGRADREAELLALEGSGTFTASKDRYNRVRRDLAAIRREWPELLGIVAVPNTMPGNVLLSLDETGFASAVAGEYTAWNCLNAQFGAEVLLMPFVSAVSIQSPYFVNAKKMASLYAQLPHVTNTHPNGRLGDSSDICLSVDGDLYLYIFKHGSGDCPAGCIENTYWGFLTESSGRPIPLGAFGRGEPTPEWFTDTRECRALL